LCKPLVESDNLTVSTEQGIGAEELAISIAARNFGPSVASLDFLQLSGVVPKDWQLARKPAANRQAAQLVFQNGVSILAQENTITVSQALTKNSDSGASTTPEVPGLVDRYLDKLSEAEYQAVTISPRILVAFPPGDDTAQSFIVNRMFAPGPWRDIGTAPVQAAVNLFYQLDRCRLTLAVNQAMIRQPEKPMMPALLFAGSFIYPASGADTSAKIAGMHHSISMWSSDVNAFREIVHQKFLGHSDSVFPS